MSLGDRGNPLKKPKPQKVRTGPGLFSRIFGLVGLAVVVALFLGFLAVLRYGDNFLAPEQVSREIVVSVPQGQSMDQTAELLEKSGIIKSADAFRWAVRIRSRLKRPVNVKAGEQALDPSLNVWETIRLLEKGNFKYYPFTVPEGLTIYDVAKAVEAAGLGSSAEFLALCRDRAFIASLGVEAPTLEGYLFPETYSFPKGTPLKSVVKAMTDQFWKVWAKYEDKAADRDMTLAQVLILASIVEKETSAPDERPLIASVFFNRLSKRMRLQTDPTVIYGLMPGFNGNLTRADLEAHTPYNTYVIDGLPPGPIANPGEAAIKAVLEPAQARYLYFVSKNDGTHHFSETLAEHNRMVNRYQRGRGGS
jgi:UPF0755 protein